MSEGDPSSGNDLSAFVAKYKVPLIIGGVVFVLYAASQPDTQPQQGFGGNPQYDSDPYYDSGPSSGDDDYERWRRDQERQEEQHERMVQETIREEQTCQDKETGEIYDDIPIGIECE